MGSCINKLENIKLFKKKNPRILIVTPEITYLPSGMGNMANQLKAKAGGLADVSASLVSALYELGADVHVALPHYRQMFHIDIGKLINDELRIYKEKLPDTQIHLAEDRIFYYRDTVYSNYQPDTSKLALAFQREVINNIIPRVSPDLIHCNDWMTGLIPAMARRRNIPCLFTVHNIHTQKYTLETIEDRGIDSAEFWKYLYYQKTPHSYQESRSSNPVDYLTSGIFAAHYINTVSPQFLTEIADGEHDFIPPQVRQEVTSKLHNDCAAGILNAPDETYNPEIDRELKFNFTSETHSSEKKKNKKALQQKVGLAVDENAPLLFWPSRLDPVQKGCQLLADILYDVISKYNNQNLQIIFVADGNFQHVFHDIVRFHDLHKRVAVCDFSDRLSRQAYASADFMLMPSKFEPCGLPQMVSPMYGNLPIVFDTGGLHDTVEHLNSTENKGNGFVFENHDPAGFAWAIDEAMRFYNSNPVNKKRQIERIMIESKEKFNHNVTAKHYFDLYEKMLKRPIVNNF